MTDLRQDVPEVRVARQQRGEEGVSARGDPRARLRWRIWVWGLDEVAHAERAALAEPEARGPPEERGALRDTTGLLRKGPLESARLEEGLEERERLLVALLQRDNVPVEPKELGEDALFAVLEPERLRAAVSEE